MSTTEENVKLWRSFLNDTVYLNNIRGQALTGNKSKFILIEFKDVQRYDTRLAQGIIEHYEIAVGECGSAIKSFAMPHGKHIEVKPRFINFPEKTNIKDFRDDHTGKMVSVRGIVRRVSDIHTRIRVASYVCQRCGGETRIPVGFDTVMRAPAFCSCNEDEKGRFALDVANSETENYQYVKLQESPDEMSNGEQPQNIDCHLTQDLVEMNIQAGRHITLNGVLGIKQKKNKDGDTPFFSKYIVAASVEKDEDEFNALEITPDDMKAILELSKDPGVYEKFIKSIAPTIQGNDDVKEAILYQLMSGVPKEGLPDKTRIRGDIHILLIGDPGVAKSQMLRSVVKLSPRAYYASGKGSSGVGLTAAATKDEISGGFVLEAGPMVLANGGLLAVDEIDKMKAEDRSNMHEGMEQQTISVAKAGIVETLNCRCAVLAAGNPKNGRFDPYETVASQIDLPEALLSRFDYIIPIRDVPNKTRDRTIAAHMLKTHMAGGQIAYKKYVNDGGVTDEMIEESCKFISPDVDDLLLRKYVAYARRKVIPQWTPEMMKMAEDLYVSVRNPDGKAADDDTISITPRNLDGIVRSCEACARVRLSNKVEATDIERVHKLFMACLKQTGIDPETGKLDSGVLEVGVSTSQRKRIKTLKEIVNDMANGNADKMVEKEMVLTAAEQNGIKREAAEKELKKLKEIGDVFEPKLGYLSPC